MSLSTGHKLGHYEILEPIGKGGMGEVYRAKDSKLGRDVAIKVLPEELAADPERLARFEREAKLLASLNHPNIATVYGLEGSNGTSFIVMELVIGETLAERIGRGPIPIEETVPLFMQIAEGLEAAHEAGVIHRDLKPANIMITPDGKSKILDFGLARAFSLQEEVSAETSQSPTLTKGTALGTILGTAAYMSPEQARGKPVDKRTDIWAFGCCLYEALTGRRAFEGETATDIIAAVVHHDPDWARLPTTTPSRMADLLKRCLTKDPRRRLRDIGDACNELAVVPMDGEVAAAEHTGRRFGASSLAIATVAGALVAAVAVWNLKPEPPLESRATFELTLDPGQELPELNFPAVAFSPDGTQIVFVAREEGTQRLYHRSLRELVARPLPGTEGGRGPFFSPDGQWVGFTGGGKLLKIPVAGGAVVPLADASTRGGTWSSNEVVIFNLHVRSGLWEVPASGGSPRELTRLDSEAGEASHRWPQMLPDGEAVLFTVSTHDTDSWDDARIVIQSLRTGERRVIVDGAAFGRYVSTGHVVYARGGQLFSVPFDPTRLEVDGPPVVVLEGLAQFPSYGSPQISLSSRGDLVYISGGVRTNGLVWVDREGTETPLSMPPSSYQHPRLSPDGSSVAVVDQGPDNEVWIHGIARGTMTRLTFEGNNNRGIWTPDGSGFLFTRNAPGEQQFRLLMKRADGSGEAEQLLVSETYFSAGSWSPSGEALALTVGISTPGRDISILSPSDTSTLSTFLKTPFDEQWPSFSPDGRWIAYQSNESGRDEIYVQPFPGPGPKLQISTEGGVEPHWASAADELFFRNGDQILAVDMPTSPTLTPGKPTLVFEAQYDHIGWDVSADGERFLMVKATPGERRRVVVVQGWAAKLKRLVATE